MIVIDLRALKCCSCRCEETVNKSFVANEEGAKIRKKIEEVSKQFAAVDVTVGIEWIYTVYNRSSEPAECGRQEKAYLQTKEESCRESSQLLRFVELSSLQTSTTRLPWIYHLEGTLLVRHSRL